MVAKLVTNINLGRAGGPLLPRLHPRARVAQGAGDLET
jgi:hypothetical protein